MATNNFGWSSVVPEVLRDDNYANWSVCMKNYLLSQDLWDPVEAANGPPNQVVDSKAWTKKSAAALHVIQMACGEENLPQIRNISIAKKAWDDLAEMHQPKPPQYFKTVAEIKENEYVKYLPLRQAVHRGNLDAMKEYLDRNLNAVNAKLTVIGWTALHIASFSGQVKIAKELVQLMSEEGLGTQDKWCWTALTIVAFNGITEIAESIVKKNNKLLETTDNNGRIPLAIAALAGHKDLTAYLYSVTPQQVLLKENSIHGSEVLSSLISSGILDIALHLLRRFPHLATTISNQGNIPIRVLARFPSRFSSSSQISFWQRWIKSCIKIQVPPPPACKDIHIYVHQKVHHEKGNITIQGQLRRLASNLLKFIGIKQLYDKNWTHVYALEVLRCISKHVSTLNASQRSEGEVHEAIFESVKHGNVWFVVEILKANCDLLWIFDGDSRNIFHLAIMYRQEKIFNLIYGLHAVKDAMVASCDAFRNNMSHLVGMLAPVTQLCRISGAALQMQRELQWFKEVESIQPDSGKGRFNDAYQTPRQVFSEAHKDLLKQGEEWMKDTATSSTVVGALIITIMFAATFTVPGGNDQTGLPTFIDTKMFTIFIVSDAISLFASTTSVLMFLGILTSHYAEGDFLKSLPTKMMIGLSTLFLSIAAMMLAFSSAIVIMLPGRLWIVLPIMLLASVPVTLFILLQYPLLHEMFISTYRSRLFNRKMKRWL